MYSNAEQLIQAGLEGKWVKVTPEDRDAIVKSIADCNLLRAAKTPGAGQGGNNLRHYEHSGYIVVHGFGIDAEEHPDDAAARQAAAIASAKAVLGQA